jgi:hypothetical protein
MPCSEIVFWSKSLFSLPIGQQGSIWLTSTRGSTVADVAHKVMGDVPISYIEGVGGTRVSEDEIVEVGKHDVSCSL